MTIGILLPYLHELFLYYIVTCSISFILPCMKALCEKTSKFLFTNTTGMTEIVMEDKKINSVEMLCSVDCCPLNTQDKMIHFCVHCCLWHHMVFNEPCQNQNIKSSSKFGSGPHGPSGPLMSHFRRSMTEWTNLLTDLYKTIIVDSLASVQIKLWCNQMSHTVLQMF